MSRRSAVPDPVMIAVDPHKRSWTAVAVDASLRQHRSIRVEANREGYRELRRFARAWTHTQWAIEGASGLGAPLATRLLADGLAVADVPAKLAARVRTLSTGHGRKTDEADALSAAVAAWTAPALMSVQFDHMAMALRALTEHRDDLVKARTHTVNRLHVLLAHLITGGATIGLTADAAALLLRRVRPRDVLGSTRRQLAVDLVAEVRRCGDRRPRGKTVPPDDPPKEPT